MIGYGYIYGGRYVSSAGVQYLVDTYSPTAAYSLRKLSSSATNAIRVRRSSDNAEQDIGFSGNDLDTASLSSFVGANSGYVVTWYNQGTGAATYDMTQSTGANQPRIVDTGTIETLNGKTSVRFINTSSTNLTASIAETSDNNEVFSVFSKVSGIASAAAFGLYGNVTNQYRSIGQSSTSANIGIVARNTATYYVDYAATNNQQYLLSGTFTASERKLYVDGTYQSNDTNTSNDFTTTSHNIGSRGPAAGGSINGHIQEVIRFTSIQDASRADINSNINSYYGIY